MNLSKETLKYILNKCEEELKNNNFEGLYEIFRHDDGISTTNIGEFSQLLLSEDLNPLNYMKEIPNCFLYDSFIKNFTIPTHITRIGAYAFADCKLLSSIIIPNSVTEIGNSAFSNCYSLLSINIPNSVIEIGVYAFENCNNLTINYQGTKEEWNKINLYKKAVTNVKHIKCVDGDIK